MELKSLLDSPQKGEQLVKKVGGVFAFKVKDGPDGKEATWVVDVKSGKGSVTNDLGKATEQSLLQQLDWKRHFKMYFHPGPLFSYL